MASTQSHYIPGFVGRNLRPSLLYGSPSVIHKFYYMLATISPQNPIRQQFFVVIFGWLEILHFLDRHIFQFYIPILSPWFLMTPLFSHQISHITIIPWNPHLIARSSFMLFAHSIDNFLASTMWNLHNLHIFPYHASFPWFSHDFPVISHDFPMEIGHEKDPRQDRQDGSRELRQLRAALRGRQQRGAAAGGLRRGGRGLPRCRGERPWENDHGGFRNDGLVLFEKDGLMWLNLYDLIWLDTKPFVGIDAGQKNESEMII